MRVKSFGAFVAALAVTSFAALPASASAEEVTLLTPEKGLLEGAPVKGFSTNLTFATKSGTVACAESTIGGEVTENPGARMMFFEDSLVGGGTMKGPNGDDLCPVAGTGGRLEARVRPIEWRENLTLFKMNGEGFGFTTIDFEVDIWDRNLSKATPIASCKYAAFVAAEFEPGIPLGLSLEAVPLLTTGGARGGSICPAEGELKGTFEITFEGEPVEAV